MEKRLPNHRLNLQALFPRESIVVDFVLVQGGRPQSITELPPNLVLRVDTKFKIS